MPLYEERVHLRAALESLLAQTYGDLALLVVDDSRSDEPGQIVREVAGERVAYVRNDRHLGLVGTWKRCFELARELHPQHTYFAWAADHDLWEPDWAAELVACLDAHADAVLAYPLGDRIDDEGSVVREPWRFETTGVGDRRRRFATTIRRMVAGDMVYGLMRTDALARSGGFRRVLLPDRLLLAELALQGEFRQVPKLLWHRRERAREGREPARQRAAHGSSSRWSRVPWSLQHAVALAWNHGLGAGVGYAFLSPGFRVARAADRRLGLRRKTFNRKYWRAYRNLREKDAGTGVDLYFASQPGQPLLVFQHLQKTAGTSLRHVLHSNFEDADMEVLGVPKDLAGSELTAWYGEVLGERAERVVCAAGHTANHLLEVVRDRPTNAITVVRDPVERIVSRYAFFSRRRSWTLEELYARVPREPRRVRSNRWQFLNGQSRLLLDPHFDVRDLPLLAEDDGSDAWRERLFSLLDERYLVGVTERFGQSVELFARELGWRVVYAARARVSAGPRPELSEELRALIRRYNWLDEELHRRALERLESVAGRAG